MYPNWPSPHQHQKTKFKNRHVFDTDGDKPDTRFLLLGNGLLLHATCYYRQVTCSLVLVTISLRVTERKQGTINTHLSNGGGDLLRHNNDRVLFINNWCFLWYHNIANV